MTREEWLNHGREYDYHSPAPAARWKRLPIVRHLRTIVESVKVEAWYNFGPGSIGIRTGFDDWVLFGMWRGWI